MTMHRFVFIALAALVATALSIASVEAQGGATVRITRPTVVLDAPRGDSIPLGSVAVGEVLDVLDHQGNWYLVSAPRTAAGTTRWDRGWVHATAAQLEGTLPGEGATRQPPGRMLIRGFGHTAGTLFSANDSFDTLFGRAFGVLYGGGAQVVLPSGIFAQVSLDRFRKTGTRVLVSGTQIFATDVPTRVTVTPVLVSVGHRSSAYRRYAPYMAVGVGWYALKEDSLALPGQDMSQGKIGYHVLGGAELPLARWVSLAGEAQFATVPKGLGQTGVSAQLAENNLGGTTFRFKLIVGY